MENYTQKFQITVKEHDKLIILFESDEYPEAQDYWTKVSNNGTDRRITLQPIKYLKYHKRFAVFNGSTEITDFHDFVLASNGHLCWGGESDSSDIPSYYKIDKDKGWHYCMIDINGLYLPTKFDVDGNVI